MSVSAAQAQGTAPGNVVYPPPLPPAAPLSPPSAARDQRELVRSQRHDAAQERHDARVLAKQSLRQERVEAQQAERGEREHARAQELAEHEADHQRRDAARLAIREERVAAREERLAEREDRLRERNSMRAEQRALRLAEHDEALQRAEAHRRLHRVLLNVAFAPSLVVRRLPEPDRGMRADAGRLRQRTVEFGVSYAHDLSERVGIKAGAAFGLGATHIGFDRKGDDCCGDGDVKVDPSYSLSLDAAPIITLGRSGFYAAPGAVMRMFFLPEHRADVSADVESRGGAGRETLTRNVGFKTPAVALAVRIALGVRLGKNHEYDLSFGGDAGSAMRNAVLYVSTFVRFGIAFTDVAHGAGG